MSIRLGILTTSRTEDTASTYANRYFNQFSYDANGNITNQARYDETGGIIDQFHYLYESLNSCTDATMRTVRNRLESVVNTSSGSLDSMDFAYDAIGNLVKEDSAQIDTIYWTVSGKIKEIVRTTSSTMKGLRFDYDPSGNRIAKHVYASNNTLETSTYYVRDAQGNILSTYELNPSSYMVKEREIYGSSRLGITKDSLELIGVDSVGTTMNFTRPIGLKRYELTNHLGNVLATISDRKLPYSSNTTTIDFYQPDILSANDYYPFGMMMVGRSFSNEGYRFGFNGQEKDDELIGSGNHTTAEFWEYDSRLSRRWNIDPVQKFDCSSYSTFRNNPLIFIDPNGDTDYFNLKGKRIGSDGIENGEMLLILSSKTERQIKKEVQRSGICTLSKVQFTTTIPVPNDALVAKLDETFTKTEKSGNTEYGMVAGTKEGGQIFSSIHVGKSGSPSEVPSFIAGDASREVAKEGAIPSYSVHSHPNVLRYNKDRDNYSTSGYGPSAGDISAAPASIFANIILELRSADPNTPSLADMRLAKATPGLWTSRTDTKSHNITFYNGTGAIKTMDFTKFKDLVKKIKNTQ